MIQQVWDKKVVVIVEIDSKDVADECHPLPLLLEIPWNHYLAFYYDEIIAFFSSYIVYPWNQNEFHLTLQNQNLNLDGTEIVGHLVTFFKEGIEKPLKFTCYFRHRFELPTIEIKKFFKYSLKASTAIRNQKFGASILTLEMSIENVDRLFESFKENNLNSYLGSKDFESGNLGFSFIRCKTEKVPVKVVGKDFIIERGADKDISLSEFLAHIFEVETLKEEEKSTNQEKISNESEQEHPIDTLQNNESIVSQSENEKIEKEEKVKRGLKYNYLFEKYRFEMHGVKLNRGEYSMGFFERFCHPDGFLYIFFFEKN